MPITSDVSIFSSVRAAREPLPRLGKWQLVRQLGEGTWSQVFQARPANCPADLPADYVVKRLKSDDDELGRRLIQRESHVASQVQHANLISVLSSHVDQPPFYLVLPFLSGTPVDLLQVDAEPMFIPKALWIARQVAEALVELHANGWLHGDVKPSNLIVSCAGHATLIDLGLARQLDSGECGPKSPLTGTLFYAPPETISSSIACDARSDIYSLGVTLFEMLTGQLPFPDNDCGRLALAHLQQPPPDPRQLAPHLSPRISRLLKRMLAKQPLRRPSSTELVEWLVDLEIDSFDERVA